VTEGFDGTFTASFTLPATIPAGEHDIRVLGGSLGSGEPNPVVSKFDVFTVTAPACGGSAAVELPSTQAKLGGPLRITGTGWCHPAGGGSRVAIKIDDGAYSHLDSSVNGNRTVWAIVDAAADGTFDTTITLPDGTARSSTPAFPSGQHTLRFLTGSLVPGDQVRTVQSAPFVVGAYQPNGTPDPVNAKKLKKSDRAKVSAQRKGKKLRVTVPKTEVGAWVYVSLYAKDGSPRYPWKKWYRLGKHHRLTLPFRTAGATGKVKLVVQSGAAADTGAVLGWAPLTLPAKKGSNRPATSPGSSGSSGSSGTGSSPAPTSSGSGTSGGSTTTPDAPDPAPPRRAAPRRRRHSRRTTTSTRPGTEPCGAPSAAACSPSPSGRSPRALRCSSTSTRRTPWRRSAGPRPTAGARSASTWPAWRRTTPR
jgi:hypothetical protein